MTPQKNQGASTFVRPPETDAPGGKVCRWTCPFCGESRTSLVAGGGRREGAMNSLRTHIRATDGNGHGPKHQYPMDPDSLALAEHVRWFDVRE